MVAQLAEAQRCKPGRGLEFIIDNSFGRTMAMGSTEPLTVVLRQHPAAEPHCNALIIDQW